MSEEEEGSGPSPELLDELIDWLRIPSVSTGEVDATAMDAAADWVCERVIAAGGTAERSYRARRATHLRSASSAAGDDDAPTVLIYGHYDVQSVGDEAAWTSTAVRARGTRRQDLRPRRGR